MADSLLYNIQQHFKHLEATAYDEFDSSGFSLLTL